MGRLRISDVISEINKLSKYIKYLNKVKDSNNEYCKTAFKD